MIEAGQNDYGERLAATAGHDSGSDPVVVQEQAMAYAREHFGQESPEHRAAFANAVCYAVTGWTGGFGGPSVREHAAGRTIRGRRLSYDEAITLFSEPEGVIFGPITDLHQRCWQQEHCFDDDPADAALRHVSRG